MNISLFSIIFCLVFCNGTSYSGELDVSDHVADLEALAKHRTWLQLLHLDKNRLPTDIVSPDFYLTETSPFSPEKELSATLDAFWQPLELEDRHSQCRYPARLIWLRSQLPKLFRHLPLKSCPALQSWLNFSAKQKIHIVHVSGYFSNPASAFGHLSLRIGDGSNQNAGNRGLLDLGINFGAKIPPDENPVSYIFKGIFGGYTAVFSNKKNYLQDQVYSGAEARDMWAYELNLSEFEMRFLVYHLWELVNVEFKYYFLRQNCAYRIAELLELVLDTPLIPENQPYYPPVDLFHRLTDFNEKERQNLINGVMFIPSHQREVYAKFDQLSVDDAMLANRIISSADISRETKDVNVEVLNFLLDYVDYREPEAAKNDQQRLRDLKKNVLVLRFQKDEEMKKKAGRLVALKPPASGPRARVFRMAAVQDYSKEKEMMELNIAPFSFDMLDNNRGSLINSSFKVLELSIRYHKNNIQFRSLNVLSVENLNVKATEITGERNLAWRGGLKIQSKSLSCSFCMQPIFELGIGKTFSIDSGLVYGLLDLSVSSVSDATGLVSLGAVWRPAGKISGRLESQFKLISSKQNEVSTWDNSASARLSLTSKDALTVNWQDEDSSVRLQYSHRW